MICGRCREESQQSVDAEGANDVQSTVGRSIQDANRRDKNPTSGTLFYNHAPHSHSLGNAHRKMLNGVNIHVKEKWRTLPHSAFIRPSACPT